MLSMESNQIHSESDPPRKKLKSSDDNALPQLNQSTNNNNKGTVP